MTPTNQQLNPGKQNFHDYRQVQTGNQLDEFLAPGKQFAQNNETTDLESLIWGYFGGTVPGVGDGPVTVEGDTVTITDDATNYIERNEKTGAVTVATDDWSGAPLTPIRLIEIADGEVVENLDMRGSSAPGSSDADTLGGQDSAYHLNRVNHTGTQTTATISDFAEAVQDAVAAALVAGSGQSITYDDLANTITFVNSAPLTTEAVQDIVGAMAASGTNVTVNYDDTAGTLTFSAAGEALTTENVQDIVAALLAQGSNVTLTYNDAAGTLTVAASGGGGGASNWGDLGGTLSNQTDLQAALDARATVSTATQTLYVDPTSGNDTTGDGTSGAPYATIQKALNMLPDIITETTAIYVNKGTTTGTISLAGKQLLTSLAIEARNGSGTALYESNTATGGSTTTLVRTGAGWGVNFWAGAKVAIYDGTGKGQTFVVTSNTSDTLTFSTITTAPDSTSRYIITGLVRLDGTGNSTVPLIASNARQLAVRGLWFDNSSASADASISYHSGVFLEYNWFSGLNNGISVSRNTNLTATFNCFVVRSGKFGMTATTGCQITPRSSLFFGHTAGVGTGIMATQQCHLAMATGTNIDTFYNLATGVSLQSGAKADSLKTQNFDSCTTNYAATMSNSNTGGAQPILFAQAFS